MVALPTMLGIIVVVLMRSISEQASLPILGTRMASSRSYPLATTHGFTSSSHTFGKRPDRARS